MMMNRAMQIAAAIAAVAPEGDSEDTNVAHVYEEPDRFLLVEKNVRGTPGQSHYFTTHPSLDEAWKYHDGQEYREDWEVTLAVDLDIGTVWVPGHTTVQWHEGVSVNGNDR